MCKSDNEGIIDITDKVKKLLGEQVKYAAVSGKTEKRSIMQDDLIEEKQNGFVLNPDWDGEVYILFDNGAEVVIAGSDYVSVIIRNDHL